MTDNLGRARCACAAGYTGANCYNVICGATSCPRYEQCRQQPDNSYVCDNYDCTLVSCSGRGACTDGVNGYTCLCIGTGYTGEECETEIDECASGACQNGATCQDTFNGYTCTCAVGYRGEFCERDSCYMNQCAAGVCIAHATNYTCQCNGTGFTGVLCNTPLPTESQSAGSSQEEDSDDTNTYIAVAAAAIMLSLSLFAFITFQITHARRRRDTENRDVKRAKSTGSAISGFSIRSGASLGSAFPTYETAY